MKRFIPSLRVLMAWRQRVRLWSYRQPLTIKVSLTLLGIDPFRAGIVTPNLMGRRPESGALNRRKPSQQTQNPVQPSTADEAFDEKSIYLSEAAIAALGKNPGDGIEISAAGKTLPFKIAGTLPGVAEGQRLAVVDIATAQWRFEKLGRLQRVDLRFAEGADESQIRNALAAALPKERRNRQ
jgi:putative ABC transport system permease protein